jgi:ribonucleotide reductase class II
MKHFKSTPTAAFIFYRSYSRFIDGARETWQSMALRCVLGLANLGKFTEDEVKLIYSQIDNCTALPSGRYMWCGGTEWGDKQVNYPGMYNCSSTVVDSIDTFGYLMDLAATGCGTGAVLELENIAKLPLIKTKLNIELVGEIGTTDKADRQEDTLVKIDIPSRSVDVAVGDSRRGWVESYAGLIQLAVSDVLGGKLTIRVDLSSVRPTGERLQGFGGSANPVKLPELYGKVAAILNGAIGRQLNSIECCKLIDEAAGTIVAGNIRRSAGIRQFSANDTLALTAKDNLWQQGDDGKWRIDPERDALRMANHTRVFHTKPTLDECIASVTKQYYSGEGAIQWAGEAVARANADLLDTPDKKAVFLGLYNGDRSMARDWLDKLGQSIEDKSILRHRMARYGGNPCFEVVGSDFMCNLAEVHLNTIDPFDLSAQSDAFKAASLNVVGLLHHEFEIPRYQRSRELDPIVGVSFTGLFDFFVQLFGIEWLNWWQAGRPKYWNDRVIDLRLDNCPYSYLTPLLKADFIQQYRFDSAADLFLAIEEEYLSAWKYIVFDTVSEYCDRHGIKCPNRSTLVQPGGSKSLLTGASSGWAPPKASRYIRRMTFGKNEPIALAAIDMGYSIIPSQSDKDENGNLLDDIHDPRVTEWLVEIPCATSWADMPGVDEIEIGKFSALAQFDFYMQVQRYYSTHTTSATIELREDEIEELATAIYEDIQSDGGYMSAALLARFESLETFPRMPFEPISKDEYDDALVAIRMRRSIDDFDEALALHDRGQTMESGPSGCDSDKCLFKAPEPK